MNPVRSSPNGFVKEGYFLTKACGDRKFSLCAAVTTSNGMKWQVFGVGISTIVSALGLGLIVWKADPAIAPLFLKTLFFIALFIFVWGSITLIVFSVKNRRPKLRPVDESTFESIFNASLLDGLAVSVIATVIFLLNKFLK